MREDIVDQLPRVVSEADDWDIIMLGFNFDVGLETEIVPGILMGGGFSVKYRSQQNLDAFVRGRAQVALQRLNLCFGICAYAISPAGARRLLQKALPMDNRPTIIKSANRSFPAYAELGQKLTQVFGFRGQLVAGGRAFLDHGCILLRCLVHLVDGRVDLLEPGRLFLGCLDDRDDVGIDVADLRDNLLQGLAGLADEIDAALDLLA